MKRIVSYLLLPALLVAVFAMLPMAAAWATDMPVGERMFICLEANPAYRWNVDGSGTMYGDDLHLNTADGTTCNFRFEKANGEYYAILHEADSGSDRYVDVEGESKAVGGQFHVWSDTSWGLSGDENRHFAFQYLGQDSKGNSRYYIYHRNSGKYVGYEDSDNSGGPSVNDDIILVGGKTVWLITSSVVPLEGGEVSEFNGMICELYLKNSLKAVNRKNDSLTNGATLHLFTMGSSDKHSFVWVEKYKAYKILPLAIEQTASPSELWDVKDESGKCNAAIHVWDVPSYDRNDNTSSLWRVVKQSDGSCKIYNARSGRYVGKNASDALIQATKANGLSFEIAKISRNSGTENYACAQTWMTSLPDEAYLTSLNIPGTHDSGTANVFLDGLGSASPSRCQKLFYSQQLNVGVRSFDIRCKADNNNPSASQVKIVHSFAACYRADGQEMLLQDFFSEGVAFLKAHPGEVLLFTIKLDSGSNHEGLARGVADCILKYRGYIWQGEGVPSLGEARGKIVIVGRRYNFGNYNPLTEDGLQTRLFGADLTKWDGFDYEATDAAIAIGERIYVQDAYNLAGADKWPYVAGTLAQSNQGRIPADCWIFNYASATTVGSEMLETGNVDGPLAVSRVINDKLYANKGGYLNGGRTGVVVMDYADLPLARRIYESNKRFDTKVSLPTAVRLVAGQSLSEAVFVGGSSNGTWMFADGSYIPAQGQGKYTAIYTPNDSRLKPVTVQLAITDWNS